MAHRRLLSAAWSVAIAAVWGCGPAQLPLRTTPVFDAPAAESIDTLAPFQRSEAFVWRLGEGNDDWNVSPSTPALEPGPGILTVPARDEQLRLSRATDLAAADFQSVTVRLVGPPPSWMQMCFTLREHEDPLCQRIDTKVAQRGDSWRFRFWPSRLPGWEGRIHEVLLIIGRAKQAVKLAAVVGEAWRLRPAALERPWRVALLGEHHLDERVALLAPIGEAFQRRVEVPAQGGVLEVAVGAWTWRPTDLEVQVSAPVSSGAEVLAAEVLARHVLPASKLGGRGQPSGDPIAWQDLELDLSRWAGSSVDLVFETRVGGHWPRSTVAAWSGFRMRSEAAVPRPNVVLVSIDTLRADHLSLYGYERSTSPVLDALAQRCGVVFEQATAPASWTLPSHLSIFTGLDPITHRVIVETRAPAKLVTLAERLRDAGYHSSAVTAGAYTSSRYGLSQGFDRYLEARGVWAPDELERGVSVALREIERLAKREPFLLFLHTYDVHAPYRPREPYASRFAETTLPQDRVVAMRKIPNEEPSDVRTREWPFWTPEDHSGGRVRIDDEGELARVVDLYDAGIAHTDARLARFFEALYASELGRRTVLVVTSDHGESLGERQLYNHRSAYENVLHVPLIFALPDCRHAGTRVASRVRLVDIAPTLLDLVGLGAPGDLDGRTLLPLLDGTERGPREAWAWAASDNRGVILYTPDGLKYVLQDSPWHPLHGQEELYDLARDPGEQRNVAAQTPRAANLRARVQERMRASAREPLLVIANAGAEPLHARVSGAPESNTVKSARPSAARLTWRGESSFDLELPPGERIELILMKGLDAPLTLHLAGDEEPLHVPAGGDAEWAARRNADAWKTLSACPSEGTRVCLVPGEEIAAALEDARLKQQLRALGYVE